MTRKKRKSAAHDAAADANLQDSGTGLAAMPHNPSPETRSAIPVSESGQESKTAPGVAGFGLWLVRENKPGFTGFVLSLIQLAGHLSWLLLIRQLTRSGRAGTLTAQDTISWVIVGLLGISMLLTFAALFVCLVFGLRKAPRLLPLTGLCLAFFSGVFATFVVLMGIVGGTENSV